MFEDETQKDKRPYVLLLDGDVFAYQGASAAEYVHNFGTTYHLMAEMEDAQRHIEHHIKALLKEIGAKKFINVLSCPTRKYWRHDIYPAYKGGRGDSRGPICLGALKDWMCEEYETYRWDNLEADDVLGILATDPDFMPEYRKVIVSIDKDMKTLPAWQFNPDKDYQPWKQTLEEADKYWLAQTIGGDSTDGYSGCRGMSPESGPSFLDGPWRWEAYDHTFKSGPRKGTTEQRWRKTEPGDTWDNILSLFAKAGMSEEDAVLNARLARICRFEDYDQEKREVKLWTPKAEN